MSSRQTLRSVARALLLVAVALMPTISPGHAAGGRYLATLVLTGLPERTTPAYQKLRQLAGAAHMQPLDMTGSETWRVPTARLIVIMQAARMSGVTVRRTDSRVGALLGSVLPSSSLSKEQAAMEAGLQASPSVMGVTLLATPEPAMAEYMLASPFAASGGGEGARIVIPLDAHETVALKRTGLVNDGDAYNWTGIVEETGQHVTLRWWPSGRLAGVIHHKGRAFAIRCLGDRMHASVEIAPERLPPEHAPAPREKLEAMKAPEDPLVRQGDASMMRGPAGDKAARTMAAVPAKGDVVITLVVAYTRAAARHYTDIRRDVIELAVAETNQSFRNSGIDNVKVELVHAYEAIYAENGTHLDHVWRFADRGDGLMEEIHGLRDQHQADVAVLIVHDPNGCGLATRVAADAEEAFAVVHHECAVTSYSIAHEIGHIIGARHDRSLDSRDTPFAYGHGIVTTRWRTMMSYKDACNGCPRVPFWSNPDVRIGGIATGHETANNARVIREQAARVAAFRGADMLVGPPQRRQADPGVADR